MENRAELGRSRMYNSGGSWEGALPPVPLFLDQTEARRAEKKIETPPPYLRVWMTVPFSLI